MREITDEQKEAIKELVEKFHKNIKEELGEKLYNMMFAISTQNLPKQIMGENK